MQYPHVEPALPLGKNHALAAIIFLLTVFSTAFAPSVVYAQTTTSQNSDARVELLAGQTLQILTDKPAIRKVTLTGNLTTASYERDVSFPRAEFTLSASAAGKYVLEVAFDQVSSYTVRLNAMNEKGAAKELLSYFVSDGSFALDIEVTFLPKPIDVTANQSIWQAFNNWFTRFGEAFPLWVKIVYLIVGAQFVFVGGMWTRYEGRRREQESSVSLYDRGNVLYLWSEILYKFLLASFLLLGLVMGGEYVLVLFLRFMFLIPIDLLSLWDLYVLGFAGSAALLAYLFRMFLGRSLDLKPSEDE